MWTTARLIDAYKARLSIPSDYALAQRWGCSRQHVSKYRRGDNTLGDDRAMQIAEEIGEDIGAVLLGIQAERAEKAGQHGTFLVLSDVIRRLGGIAACFLLFAGALPANDAHAAEGLQLDNNANYAARYALTPRRRAGFLAFLVRDMLRTIASFLRAPVAPLSC